MKRLPLWLLILGLLAAACASEAGVSTTITATGGDVGQTAPDRSSTAGPANESTDVADSATTTTVAAATPTTVPWATASLGSRPEPVRQPTRLVIGSLEIDAPVVPKGVDGEGAMDVPSNVTDVAWYRFGSSPGEPGSSVLAAHVDLASFGPGVFFDIDQMTSGDQVVVEYDDSSIQKFEVTEVERVSKENLDVAALFAETGDPTLRLVTCGGGFNPQLRRYDSNVIVTLSPTGGTG